MLQNVKNIEAKEGRTANWSEAYRKWADEVDKLQAKLSVLQKQQANMTTPQIFKTSDLRSANIPYMQKVSNTIEKQMPELQKMLNAHNWKLADVKGIEDIDGKIKTLTVTVRDAEGALKQFVMQRAKLQGGGKAQAGLMQVGDVKVLETASQAQAKLDQQTENANTKLKEQVNKIQLSMSTGGYESKVDSLIGKTQQWVDANGNARISTDALQTAMNNLNTAYANITATGGNTVANQKALIEAERALDTEVKKVQSSVTSMNATMAKSTTVDSLRQKVQMFYDTNTKSHRTYGAQLRAIVSELATGAEVPITRLRQIQQEFIGIQNSARQAGKLGLSFFDTVKQGMKSFSYWTSSTFLVMKAIQEVRQVITNVKELDNAMMDLTMATGYNKNQVEELMDTYFKLGEELSATATDVAASADTWLRQGKSIAETNELIKDSMVLSKISGLSAEESTKYLTSAMKGYKVATEDVLGVVDKLSAVDMASATDVGGLAEGMSEVAASADLAGVSMDKLLGYLAIVGETTQSGMSEVGTSFNAIFARMGNIKLARLKDYQNNGEDLSNVETVLRGEGIVLRDSVNEFRNFGEVLDEVAGRWTSFSEVSQRAIASAFAG